MTNIQHVDSDLKGGMIERQRSDIQVVLDLAGIDDDGLAAQERFEWIRQTFSPELGYTPADFRGQATAFWETDSKSQGGGIRIGHDFRFE